jgi:hypothetical protein
LIRRATKLIHFGVRFDRRRAMARKRKSAWTTYVLAQLLGETQSVESDQLGSTPPKRASDVTPDDGDKSQLGGRVDHDRPLEGSAMMAVRQGFEF